MLNIDETIKTQKYYAGFLIKNLPKGAVDLHRCSKKRLSKRTLECLTQFEQRFNINWYSYLRYDIITSERYYNRSGFIIYGILDYQNKFNKYITYFRKETPSPAAGQTHIYVRNSIRLSKTIILNQDINSRCSTIYKEACYRDIDIWNSIVERK